VYQRAANDRLSQYSNRWIRFNGHKIWISSFVLLVVVPKHGVNIKSPCCPFSVHESAGIESHLDKLVHRGSIQSDVAI